MVQMVQLACCAVLFSLFAAANALLPSTRAAPKSPALTRRAALALPAAAAASLALSAQMAHASGGSTAGKTTSIPRAKLRYYDRVTDAVASFKGLSKAFAGGSMQEVKAFFAQDGPFEELKGAGYLLAVAFKIDSKISPDRIIAVKMHKKMMADLEKLKGAKKAEEADKLYSGAISSLEEYLTGVELPPLADSRYDF